MATLNVDVPDELAEEFNRLFANVDPDALVTTLLVDLLDRIRRLPSARQVIADNPDLPIGFVLDLLEARAEGRQSAMPFLPVMALRYPIVITELMEVSSCHEVSW